MPAAERFLPLLACAALALALVSGCTEEEACAADTDCGAGQRCEDGACVQLTLGASCGGPADCSAGEECRGGTCQLPVVGPEETLCSVEDDPACAAGEVCRPVAVECPAGATCPAKLVCQPPVGETLGRRACAADAECRSGTCVSGACLMPCTGDVSCGLGFACREQLLADGSRATGCVGVTPDGAEAPTQTACDGDADCLGEYVCQFYDGNRLDFGEGFGVCRIPPEGALADGTLCSDPEDSSLCRGNLCERQCRGPRVDVCGILTCTKPCGEDADCEFPHVCVTSEYGSPADYAVKRCGLPNGGCFDSLDCCPRTTAGGACEGGWTTDLQVCGLTILGGEPRRVCLPPDAPGTACTSDAECSTGLCVESGGRSICTVACDPARADCESHVPGSACTPLEREFGGRTLSLTVCQ